MPSTTRVVLRLFSSKKEVDDPWPLHLLGEVRMDPDPEEGVGEEGGEWGRTKGTAARTTRRRGTPRWPSSPFLGEGDEGAWFPPLLSLGDVMLDPDPDQLYSTNK